MRPSESRRAQIAVFAALAAGVVAHSPVIAATFNDNDFLTWSQVAWGDVPAPGNISYLLETDFDSVFAPEGDLLQVGLPSPGHFLVFDSADAIINYLPASGAPGPLIASLDDPVTTSSGSLGGEVVTLALNVDFSDAGLLTGNLSIPFGDLMLTGLSGDLAFANGMSVRSLLPDADSVLGGGPLPSPGLSYSDFFILLNEIDMSFNGGPVSTFADDHLELPASTVTVTEPGSLGTAAAGMLFLGIAAVLRGRRTLKL